MNTQSFSQEPVPEFTDAIEPYRRRTPHANEEVWVYRNLMRRGGPWYSLRQHGIVVGHARLVILIDARFVVHEAGRRRLLETGVKNVHAFVVGRLMTFPCTPCSDPFERVRYRPQIFSTFVDVHGARVTRARLVTLGPDGVFAEDPQ